MADKEVKLVEVELLADLMKYEGVEYHKGDLVEVPESSVAGLRKHGSVGDPGTLEKIQASRAASARADAEAQALLTGGGTPEDYSKAQAEAREAQEEAQQVVAEQAADEDEDDEGGAHAAPKPATRRPGRRPSSS